jgi:hypothetical protein
VNRDSGTASANGGSGDFHEKAVMSKDFSTCFWLEGAMLARQERIALPSELTRESGSRLDPKSLQREERDHLVIGLALRRLCRRTVITPRLASIPSLLLKAFLFLFVWFSQALPPGSTPGTWFFLGIFNQRFAQTLPSHSILLGVIV